MPTTGKKLTILAILEILREHSDAEHRLLQADIIEWLRKDYDLTVTRKTVRQNITDLQEAGYPLEYENGWYYEHEFCEAELNLLIQGLLFNSFVPPTQRREMINKLKKLGGSHYTPRTFDGTSRPANPQFLYSLETVQAAVEHERKIEFQYVEFDVDKKLHPRLNSQGEPRRYLVNPYHIAISNGRYYVIGNVDKYDNVAHFRLDRMAECRELDAPAKPMSWVRGLENGLNISEYLTSRVFMYSGNTILARIRVQRSLVGEILDRFGMDVQFEKVTDDTVDAVFRTDEESLSYWLRMYGDKVERL